MDCKGKIDSSETGRIAAAPIQMRDNGGWTRVTVVMERCGWF